MHLKGIRSSNRQKTNGVRKGCSFFFFFSAFFCIETNNKGQISDKDEMKLCVSKTIEILSYPLKIDWYDAIKIELHVKGIT